MVITDAGNEVAEYFDFLGARENVARHAIILFEFFEVSDEILFFFFFIGREITCMFVEFGN